MKTKQKILIDADVLIHLFKADRITILDELFKDQLIMLDVVLDELRANRTISNYLDSIFLFSPIKEVKFPTSSNEQIFSEFVSLKNQIRGKGERASLLYCKYNQNIIASSNTKDIIPFCNTHSISYLTTLDIFCIAIKRNKITEIEANNYISKIISLNSFLCCNSIQVHLKNHFDPIKYLF